MKRLLVTVDSLRLDHYQYMPKTQSALGDTHQRVFSTASATMGAFPSMFTGDYEKIEDEMDPGRSFVTDIDDFSVGITTNRLVSERYGYDDGFDHFTSPITRGDESLKDKIAPHIPDSLYGPASDVWSLFQKTTEIVSETPKSFRRTEDVIDEFFEVTEDKDDWFAWLHLMEPHHPYDPDGTDLTRAKSQSISREAIASGDPDDPDLVRELYRQEVREVDAQLSRLWRSIDSDTQIIFTADHGEMLGERGIWGHPGMTMEPEILRIPFGIKGFDVESSVVSFMDVRDLFRGIDVDRDVAYASMGEAKIVMNERHMATETEVFDFSRNPAEDSDLQDKLEEFKPSGITKRDGLKEDLRALGYVD